MCIDCGWAELAEEIERMLGTIHYRFARATLEGIYVTINQSVHATDKQRAAVTNIRNSLGRGRSGRRRPRSSSLFGSGER